MKYYMNFQPVHPSACYDYKRDLWTVTLHTAGEVAEFLQALNMPVIIRNYDLVMETAEIVTD